MQTETELTAAWLAEHIMGWPKISTDASYREGPFPAYLIGYEGVVQVYDERSLSIFSPLERIADAWQIVEAIRAKSAPKSGLYYTIEVAECNPRLSDYPCYRARFVRIGHELWQHAPTAPVAICHAAYDWWHYHYAERGAQ